MHEIVKYPSPILREISEPVKLPLSVDDRKILDEMYSFVKDPASNAVGLSAIQIGIKKRMCVIRLVGEKTIGYKLVNPKIIKRSANKYYLEEGCLSVDEEHHEVIGRYDQVTVMAFDAIQNKNIIINTSGFLARVLQHEIDHMDGKLYIDYINEVKE